MVSIKRQSPPKSKQENTDPQDDQEYLAKEPMILFDIFFLSVTISSNG